MSSLSHLFLPVQSMIKRLACSCLLAQIGIQCDYHKDVQNMQHILKSYNQQTHNFETSFWIFGCTRLVCGWAGSAQSELLRVRNFRGLSAGNVDSLVDVIFSVRGILYCSKGYMSRRCWLIPERYAQAFNQQIQRLSHSAVFSSKRRFKLESGNNSKSSFYMKDKRRSFKYDTKLFKNTQNIRL